MQWKRHEERQREREIHCHKSNVFLWILVRRSHRRPAEEPQLSASSACSFQPRFSSFIQEDLQCYSIWRIWRRGAPSAIPNSISQLINKKVYVYYLSFGRGLRHSLNELYIYIYIKGTICCRTVYSLAMLISFPTAICSTLAILGRSCSVIHSPSQQHKCPFHHFYSSRGQ